MPRDLPREVQTVLDGVYALGGFVVMLGVSPILIAESYGDDAYEDSVGMHIADGLIGVLGRITNQDYGR